MTAIIDHDHKEYRRRWEQTGDNRWNGAFYYSKEIVKNIIPRVRTSRNWITINVPTFGCDHAIVFIHNNLHPEVYKWLKNYDDIILVCGIPETAEKMKHIAPSIYLPLSIDVDYVQQFRRNKYKKRAYVGRPEKRLEASFKHGTEYLEGLPRQELLPRMATYEEVYAVGRTAIEAKALGCKVLPYDPRFPDPDRWVVMDNREAAVILQEEIDKIDERF